MIKVKKFKGIEILDKPKGKLRKNDGLSPDEIVNSKNYYIVKSFAPIKRARIDDYILYTLYNTNNRFLGSALVYFRAMMRIIQPVPMLKLLNHTREKN